MSNNQLNDISKVYLSQVAEETPGERIDRKSQEGVAKRKAAAASETESRAKKAGEFQKHRQSVLAKGGRHVDALDSWHKKQAYERNAKTRSEALMSSEELKEKEIYKGKHGQSEKEYQAGRSDAGKRISGDEKHGPASYTRRGVKQQEPTKPGEKPEHTPKLGSAEKNELAYRKSRLKKEDVEFVDNLIESGKFSDEEIEKIVEAQAARNDPEKYERDQEKKDTRSKKQKRMDDPDIGINSPAFKKFMQQMNESGLFSEEEIKIILWNEGYQRNPEKGEAEERKAEKSRKESGRMPPRGDKRREDFEKWYAANVR